MQEETQPLLSPQQESEFLFSELQPPPLSCNPRILCVFVTAFDTRAGNVIEWQYPGTFSLSGVEFKTLPSGAHNVQHDAMLFELHSDFGIAAYFMKQVDNAAERGARMKSVGVVCDNFLALFQHEEKLVELAREAVEDPGNYEQLVRYVEEFNEGCGNETLVLDVKPSAVGSMYDLFKSQGVHIFALWKSLLLQKRVLLHCTPPIARHCSYVMCLTALSYTLFTESNPIFYVTVNDMTALTMKQSYIACSADMILKTKGSQVYDVYVTGSGVLDDKGNILPVTRGDIIRYNHLCAVVDREYGEKNTSEIDSMIQMYFVKLTSDIFTTFSNLMAGSRRMETSHLKDIRFHSSDLPFLQTLVDKLGYDVELIQPGCCEESLDSLFG